MARLDLLASGFFDKRFWFGELVCQDWCTFFVMANGWLLCLVANASFNPVSGLHLEFFSSWKLLVRSVGGLFIGLCSWN